MPTLDPALTLDPVPTLDPALTLDPYPRYVVLTPPWEYLLAGRVVNRVVQSRQDSKALIRLREYRFTSVELAAALLMRASVAVLTRTG